MICIDWSTDQGIDPKMLYLNHVMFHPPQEEPLDRIPPSEQYLPNMGESLPGPDLEMHMDVGMPMGLNERAVAQNAFPFNGAIGKLQLTP